MRIWIAVLALAGASVGAWGQSAEPPCTFGVYTFMAVGWENRAGAPYSATIKLTSEHKLSDGNVVRGTSQVREARNTAGTFRSELAGQCMRGEDGQMHLQSNVSIHAADRKSTLTWSVGPVADGLARMSQFPARREQTEEEAASEKARMAIFRLQVPSQREYKREDLGTKNILGVMAQGWRTTRTIPAGEEGNEQRLVVMTETWHSKEAGLTLAQIDDDPRTGRRTYEVEELSLGEPDPALFQPPADYKVKDTSAQQP